MAVMKCFRIIVYRVYTLIPEAMTIPVDNNSFVWSTSVILRPRRDSRRENQLKIGSRTKLVVIKNVNGIGNLHIDDSRTVHKRPSRRFYRIVCTADHIRRDSWFHKQQNVISFATNKFRKLLYFIVRKNYFYYCYYFVRPTLL